MHIGNGYLYYGMKKTWDPAVVTASFIPNTLYRTSVGDTKKTLPYTKRLPESPDVSFLRTFGARALLLVSK